MTRLGILAEIKTLLEAVTNIGQVHDSIRWTIHNDEFIKAFASTINDQEEIRCWMIYRESGGIAYGASQSSLGTGVSIPTNTSLSKHDFTIEGWASFKDNDTDSEFQALVDSVLDKFKNQITLNSTGVLRGPINYTIDHMFFGDYFVHHVMLNFYAAETEGITVA